MAIPDEIPEVVTAVPETMEEGIEGGVEGGIEGGTVGGVIGGVVGGVLTEVPPPRPPDVPSTALVVPLGEELPLIIVNKAPPRYPYRAWRSGIQGSVLVRYIIDRRGRVREVRILEPAHESLNNEAVSAIRTWRFQPHHVDGKAVEVVHDLRVIFELTGRRNS